MSKKKVRKLSPVQGISTGPLVEPLLPDPTHRPKELPQTPLARRSPIALVVTPLWTPAAPGSLALAQNDQALSPPAIAAVLKEEGFARLPRRSDEGLALFAGLNVIPKRSFLTEYSCRIDPGSYPKLMRRWFDAMNPVGLERGSFFDLDFRTIPFHGEEALVEKHYVSKRSRRQKSILAFLAQDAGTRAFCYANAQLRKEDQNDEILRFVDFWKERTGKYPEALMFDSKLTTYANLNRLNEKNIAFMTLRRRSLKMLRLITQEPISAWRRIELDGVARAYKTPGIIDRKINIEAYQGPIWELTITDLGHEEPTLQLTNQLQRSPAKLIGRYTQRMIFKNNIADSIDFFHMDALSSAVAMKMDCDLQLTLMASSLYRLLATEIGNGYQTAKSRHIFRDFIEATAHVTIDEQGIEVRFQKRAQNPYLIAAGFGKKETVIPWMGKKRVSLVFG